MPRITSTGTTYTFEVSISLSCMITILQYTINSAHMITTKISFNEHQACQTGSNRK